jgi:ComF family protein
MKASRYVDDLIALFYPRTCMACGNTLFRQEETLCTYCLFHLPRTNFHKEPDNPLSRVFWGRVSLTAATAYYHFGKGGKVQHLIHQLKYKGHKEIGVYIGSLYGAELREEPLYEDIDTIIPVPLHQSKFRSRGYNQSEQFAMGLSSSMPAALEVQLLYRTYASETQTKKSRYNRWENVKEIFALQDEARLKGKHILLVDDVITTGATIESCAAILLKIPEVRVSVVALACAIK